MADVFISYKKEEREKAHAIAVALEALSVSTWLDAQLSPGQSFTEEIREELARCKAQLVCWSKAAIRSEWVLGEAEIGRRRGILLPVFIEHCELLPPFNMIHAEDLTGWSGEQDHPQWQNVLRRLAILTARPGLPSLSKLLKSDSAVEWRAWAVRYPTDPAVASTHAASDISGSAKDTRERTSENSSSPPSADTAPPTLADLLSAAQAADFRLRVFRDAAKKYGWKRTEEEQRLELEAAALRRAIADTKKEHSPKPQHRTFFAGLWTEFAKRSLLEKLAITIVAMIAVLLARSVMLELVFASQVNVPAEQANRETPIQEQALEAADPSPQAARFDTQLLGPVGNFPQFEGDFEAVGLDPVWALQLTDDYAALFFRDGASYQSYSGEREVRAEGAQLTFSVGEPMVVVLVRRSCQLLNGVQTGYTLFLRTSFRTYEGCARETHSEHWPPWDHEGSVAWRFEPRPFDDEM